tara:strand:+ start:2426 stop:2785 length:360 start_codon:yes stop_codon:yes gene_type:complete
MTRPIYASQQHQAIVDVYLNMCKEFAQEVSTKTKYKNYLEVLDVIFEYHNNYGKGVRETGNFYDWIMIIPINTSVATNGFFAALETRSNRAIIRAYKVVLEQMLHEAVDKIDSLEFKNE